MGAGGKRPVTPIVCYDMGVRMGLRPAEEWAEILQVHRKVIYEKKNNGQRLMKRYTFAAASPEEVKHWREAHNLSEMAKAAREQGLSYGELVARKWMEGQQHKEEEAMEEATVMDPVEETVPEEETPKKTKLAFADFAALIDGHVILDLYSRQDGEESWLMSIPSDSPMMAAGVISGTVEQIRVVAGENRALRIYLR